MEILNKLLKKLIFMIWPKKFLSVKKSCWTYTLLKHAETCLKTARSILLKIFLHIAAGKMHRKKFCHTPTFKGLNSDHVHRFGPGDHVHGDNKIFII